MKIQLIGDNQKDVVSYLANIARISTGRYKEDFVINDDKDFDTVKNLLTMGHLSVFEFVDYTWYVKGISRACSHQLVRHRLASYIQESERYVKYDIDDTIWDEYIFPEGTPQEVQDDCKLQSFAQYTKMIRSGIKPEDARMVLPLSFPTKMVVKMNLREFLFSFYKLRADKRAQTEIRDLANRMMDCLLHIDDSKLHKFLNLFLNLEKGGK